MADDIEIVISAKEKPGSKAVVEAMRAKLAEYRQELILLAGLETNFRNIQEAQGGDTSGQAESLELIKKEVDDVTAKYVRMGEALDISSKTAVVAFQAETAELTRFITGLNIGTEATQKLDLALESVQQRQVKAAADSAKPGPAAPRMGANAGPQLPDAVERLITDVNVAIGAFVRLGRIVDVTSAEAVAGYRAQGEALAANLARIGATDVELNRLGSSVARVEQAYGAYTAEVNNNIQSTDRIPVSARRGANAVATLAFGLQAGGTSARTMAIALGSTVSAMAAFSDSAKVAAAASGIGALVTILAVVIGLFYDLNHEVEKADNGFKNLGSLRATQLKVLITASDTHVAALAKEANAAAELVEREKNSLNVITNVRAAFDTKEARRKDDVYQTALKENQKFHQALTAAETQEGREIEKEMRSQSDKAAELTTDRLRGPAAARELAARHERDDALRELKLKTGDENQIRVAREAIEKQYTEKVLTIRRDRQTKIDDMDRQFNDQVLTATEKLNNDVFGVQQAAAYRKFKLDEEKIKNDRDLDPATKVRLQKKAEDAWTAAYISIEHDRQEEIIRIREEAQGKLDEIAGRGVNEEKIRQSYKKQIDVLQAAINSPDALPEDQAAARAGIKLIEALIPQEVAKARLAQINKDTERALASTEQTIERTKDLQDAHLLTDQEARVRNIAALEKQREIVAASIPLLQEQARLLPGDVEAQERVEQMTTRLLQLTIAVAHAKDEFYLLKEAGINATQDAITKFITSLPQVLGGQGLQIQNIRTIRDNLASAKQQMDFFMNQPRTSETLDRITSLRTEIARTNLELNQAKSELKSWESLFVDAARSIVQALFEVETRMLAVYLIQQALHMFGFGGAGGTTALQIAGEAVGGSTSAATGGLIRGPGTSTSDSILARLSNNEYVINAAAVSRVGVGFLDAINGLGSMPTISHRYGYADGGLVSQDSQKSGGGSMEATLGLEEGLVVRHMQTSAGVRAILTAIGSNRKAVKALIGT